MSGFIPAMDTVMLRLLMIAAALGGWFLAQRLIAARATTNGEITDYLHVATARWNESLRRSPRVANGLLVASSAGIDILTLFVLGWSVFGPSFMPFWGLFGLFVLRQISQAAVALPAPPGIIWHDPGVPSLFVTYHVGNDLFFSGIPRWPCTGMQLATLNVPSLAVLGFAVALAEMAVVIVLRAHWTMDVVAGAFAACAAGLLVWPS